MAPHKPRKSTPEQDSEDEDMIEYHPEEFDPDEYVQNLNKSDESQTVKIYEGKERSDPERLEFFQAFGADEAANCVGVAPSRASATSRSVSHRPFFEEN
ncbi:hypothetical protein TNCV_3950051 [Trichonephila clavipes]|nr:hypothetical protein TNCV_3950051 [Trichonephila clavipes]